MVTKRAKTLDEDTLDVILAGLQQTEQEMRDRVIILLSFKAGLRSGEIAGLRVEHVTDTQGRVTSPMRIGSDITKNGRRFRHRDREIDLHPDLRRALQAYFATRGDLNPSDPVILNARGRGGMTPNALQQWFRRLYLHAGLQGASSHSGRRTFATRALRLAGAHGMTLFDIQRLLGHRDPTTTQAYIENHPETRRLIAEL